MNIISIGYVILSIIMFAFILLDMFNTIMPLAVMALVAVSNLFIILSSYVNVFFLADENKNFKLPSFSGMWASINFVAIGNWLAMNNGSIFTLLLSLAFVIIGLYCIAFFVDAYEESPEIYTLLDEAKKANEESNKIKNLSRELKGK